MDGWHWMKLVDLKDSIQMIILSSLYSLIERNSKCLEFKPFHMPFLLYPPSSLGKGNWNIFQPDLSGVYPASTPPHRKVLPHTSPGTALTLILPLCILKCEGSKRNACENIRVKFLQPIIDQKVICNIITYFHKSRTRVYMNASPYNAYSHFALNPNYIL